MPTIPLTFRPPWLPRDRVKRHIDKRSAERRGSARQRGYNSHWDKARLAYLRHHPLCVCCEANGVVHAAGLVDHVEPHKGDKAKFWDSANWQSLCEWCDKNLKRSVENDWLAGRADGRELSLARRLPGWVHPADR